MLGDFFDQHALKLAVIGNPIQHSQSPRIHKYFGLALGVALSYERIYAPVDQFEAVVAQFFAKGGHGVNITLPFKVRAAAIADQLSPRAQLVGAVNTLCRTDEGLFGDTTDGEGFICDLQRLGTTSAFAGDVVILGAGGAVRSIMPDLLEMQPNSITILNRTLNNAKMLVRELEGWRKKLGFSTLLFAGDLDEDVASLNITLLVQGASGAFSWDRSLKLDECFCYDLNYGARSQHFQQWAKACGARAVHDGLGMLIGQAAASFQIWTGKTPVIEDVMLSFETANPWLEDWWCPPFERINYEQLHDAIVYRLSEKTSLFKQRMYDLRQGTIPLSWDSFVRFYEHLDDKLDRVWSVMGHLNAVASDERLREMYNRLQVDISDHYTEERQNSNFRELVSQLLLINGAEDFTPAQHKWCEQALDNFRLAGVDLPLQQKTRFANLERQLSELSTTFSDCVMDGTEVWFLDVSLLEMEGLPASTLAIAQETFNAANPKSKESLYRLTLKAPCYLAVMKFCHSQTIREQLYRGFATRASHDDFDTSALIETILQHRTEQVSLLGFPHYAAYSLSNKMADTAEQVIEFLQKLAALSKPQALREKQALDDLAAELGLSAPKAWDYIYLGEQLKARQFSLDAELVREYFPTQQVLSGLFEFIHNLFKVECVINQAVATYRHDVQFVELRRGDKLIGGLYLDLYARDKKREGAWMDECRQRYVTDEGRISLPIAYLVCNSSPPAGDKPSLMTHDEVVTIFHEVGHCLHHLLSTVNVAGVSGIRGVEWDAVEVPSQLIESWCYRAEVLSLLSSHYKTGLPLPKAMLGQLIAAKNFQSALQMTKQLEFALYDMLLHMVDWTDRSHKTSFLAVMTRVQKQIAVLPVPN